MSIWNVFKKDSSEGRDEKNGTICVLIDFENLAISYKESNNCLLNLQPVLDLAKESGNSDQIAIARAYADWRHFSRFADALIRMGIQTIQAPSHRHQGKNATDIQMAVEATDLLNQRKNLELFVLVTGDSDFNPLVNLLHERGKQVIGIGVEGSVSPYLEDLCDEFYFYDALCGEEVEKKSKSPKKPVSKKRPTTPKKENRPQPLKKKISKPVNVKLEKSVKETTRNKVVAGSSADNAIEILGLDPDFRFKSNRLKQLLPLASELALQADSGRASDFKKMLPLKFPNEINSREASVLAHLLQRTKALHSRGTSGWLTIGNLDGETGFDMLLASIQEKLVSEKWKEARDVQKIGEMLFEDKVDKSELSMRISRGNKLLQEFKNRH